MDCGGGEGAGAGEARAHRGQHGAIAVEEAAVVEPGKALLVLLLLHGELARPPREGEDVAGVLVRGDRLLRGDALLAVLLRPPRADLGEPIARRVLELGVLGERDADRVAQAVGEERADPDRRLHPSVLALARLGDAEVERVVPAEAVLLGGEEAVRLHHHQRVRRLHREDEVVVVVGAADVGELDRRLDHPARRVAVEGKGARRERAVVGADPHRAVALLALLDERREHLDEVVAVLVVVEGREGHQKNCAEVWKNCAELQDCAASPCSSPRRSRRRSPRSSCGRRQSCPG